MQNYTKDQIAALTKEQIDADNQLIDADNKFRDQLRALFLKIEKTEQENYRGMEQWQIEFIHKLRDQLRAVFPKTEPEQFSILRENDALKTKEQVLELSKQNPFLIRLLSVDETQALTEEEIHALTKAQIDALRQNKFLKTKEQVLELSKRNPFLIRTLRIDETQALTAGQFAALTGDQFAALTTEQLVALSYSMQELNPTSPRESPRASSWTAVVVKGKEITTREI